MIYVSYSTAGNEWNEGAWAELLKSFSVQPYDNQQVETRVLVQPQHGRFVQGEIDLTEFSHPEGDVLYIFGSDHAQLEQAPSHDISVYIPQRSTTVTLWSHQAAAVVLWDRVLQHGDN